MGFPTAAPTNAHIDNAALYAILDSERIIPCCRHLDIPIAILHEQKDKSFVPRLIRTYYMLADIGTKPLTAALHRRLKYWLLGEQFYPVPETEHYNLLHMEFYETNFVMIVCHYQS